MTDEWWDFEPAVPVGELSDQEGAWLQAMPGWGHVVPPVNGDRIGAKFDALLAERDRYREALERQRKFCPECGASIFPSANSQEPTDA